MRLTLFEVVYFFNSKAKLSKRALCRVWVGGKFGSAELIRADKGNYLWLVRRGQLMQKKLGLLNTFVLNQITLSP